MYRKTLQRWNLLDVPSERLKTHSMAERILQAPLCTSDTSMLWKHKVGNNSIQSKECYVCCAAQRAHARERCRSTTWLLNRTAAASPDNNTPAAHLHLKHTPTPPGRNAGNELCRPLLSGGGDLWHILSAPFECGTTWFPKSAAMGEWVAHRGARTDAKAFVHLRRRSGAVFGRWHQNTHHTPSYVQPGFSLLLPQCSKRTNHTFWLLHLFFVILCRFWLQLWFCRVGGRTHA